MNCQRFENIVSELARGQMMAAKQRGEALAHSDACEHCAARLRDEEMLTRGLQSLAAQMDHLAAPDQLEAQLLEAFRTHPGAAATRHFRSRYWLAAVAAVLLIAMSLVALRWRSNPVDVPRQAVVVPSSPKTPEEKPLREEPRRDVEYQAANDTPRQRITKPPRHRQVRSSENTQTASLGGNEIATDFIPLRYMNAANLQDGGQIVRVELPRSTLANFGLPVNMDRYNEKVKADVLYGVDGLAHAIRFVQ